MRLHRKGRSTDWAVGSKILPETSFGGAVTYTKSLQDLEQLILEETWKPSRNQKLVEDARAGKFPNLKELHNHLIHKILREKPKWSVALKELKNLEHPDQVSSFANSCLQEIRAAVFVSLELIDGTASWRLHRFAKRIAALIKR